MNTQELHRVLAEHAKWVSREGGQRANLRRANLQGADLQDADLQDANLRGANLDFSVWPLWCGSIGAIVDSRIQRQLLYHAYATDNPEQDADIAELFQSELFRRVIAKFHRFDQCGGFRHEKLKEEKQ